MSVEVRIPPVLRKHVGGSSTVSANGTTVSEVIASIDEKHPGFRSQITDPAGELHRFINLYRNGEDVRYLGKLDATVSDGDVVAILPAVAGG
jgi:molybdopterin converting factor small subunit